MNTISCNLTLWLIIASLIYLIITARNIIIGKQLDDEIRKQLIELDKPLPDEKRYK